MLTLDSPASAQLVAGAVGPVMLFELDFTTGMRRLCTWSDTLTIGGFDYTPVGGAVSVAAISESEDTSVDKLSLTVPLVNQAMLASVLTSIETYRGKPGRIYLQLVNEKFQPVGAKVLRYSGYMEPARVSREKGDEAGNNGGISGTITLDLSRAGLVRSRNFEGIRASHQQQQQRYPTDKGFEYMQGLINLPAQWLSKAFQWQ